MDKVLTGIADVYKGIKRKWVWHRTCQAFFATATSQSPGLPGDLGDRLQSRNVPFGTSGDCAMTAPKGYRKDINILYNKIKEEGRTYRRGEGKNEDTDRGG